MSRKGGFKHSEETKKLISLKASGKGNSQYGKKQSEEIKKKRGLYKTGKENKRYGLTHTKKTKLKISISKIGYSHTQETKEKISENMSKENHWNWQNGLSFEIYPLEFNDKLKEKIRKRDNYTCQLCEVKEENHYRKLDVHHIDYNKKNNNINDLITLCTSCHCKTNHNRKYWREVFNGIKIC